MIKCSKQQDEEKQDFYWPKDLMNDVITVYKNTEKTETRSDIYQIYIHNRLEKMNEIWARKILGTHATDSIITDGLSFAATILDKFDTKYGDAFGFLSISIKRYYQQISMNGQKYYNRNTSIII